MVHDELPALQRQHHASRGVKLASNVRLEEGRSSIGCEPACAIGMPIGPVARVLAKQAVSMEAKGRVAKSVTVDTIRRALAEHAAQALRVLDGPLRLDVHREGTRIQGLSYGMQSARSEIATCRSTQGTDWHAAGWSTSPSGRDQVSARSHPPCIGPEDVHERASAYNISQR